MEHFLTRCKKLEPMRDKEIMKELDKMKKERKIPHLLFKMKNYEMISDMIYKMWLLRKVLLKPP